MLGYGVIHVSEPISLADDCGWIEGEAPVLSLGGRFCQDVERMERSLKETRNLVIVTFQK